MKPFFAILMFFLSLTIFNADPLNAAEIKDNPVHLIMVDPGFGGTENGPVGCNGSIPAKEITLKLSKKVVQVIKNELQIETLLTRDKDIYLSPEERAAIANTKGADLLLSIYINGSEDPSVSGIETYYLQIATRPDAVRTAVAENTTDPKNIADLNSILSELMSNTKSQDSERLANHVQRELCAHLSRKYDRIKNRGIKHAPFYLFLAAEMPSIMVQVSFITNSNECRRIISESYQDEISAGIVNGLRKYLNKNQ